jgi:hypothetical protein
MQFSPNLGSIFWQDMVVCLETSRFIGTILLSAAILVLKDKTSKEVNSCQLPAHRVKHVSWFFMHGTWFLEWNLVNTI